MKKESSHYKDRDWLPDALEVRLGRFGALRIIRQRELCLHLGLVGGEARVLVLCLALLTPQEDSEAGDEQNGAKDEHKDPPGKDVLDRGRQS